MAPMTPAGLGVHGICGSGLFGCPHGTHDSSLAGVPMGSMGNLTNILSSGLCWTALRDMETGIYEGRMDLGAS